MLGMVNMMNFVAAAIFALIPFLTQPWAIALAVFFGVSTLSLYFRDLAMALSRNQGKIAGKIEKLQLEVDRLP